MVYTLCDTRFTDVNPVLVGCRFYPRHCVLKAKNDDPIREVNFCTNTYCAKHRETWL